MSDRTRTPAIASCVAAGLLLISASLAAAQATQDKKAPPERHVDLEAGVGVHWGLENDVPIEDDVYAGIGVAAPILDHLDGEFQAAYWSARDNDHEDEGRPNQEDNDTRDGWHFNTGLRWYPMTEPDSRVRPYLSSGTSIITDFREDDDVTFGMTVGPGIRIRLGDRSGLLARVPVLVQIEDTADPMLIPTLNYFISF